MDSITTNLPKNFLDGEAPNPSKNVINFVDTELKIENEGLYAVVLDGILSVEECQQLTAAAEARTGGNWERALVNIGNGQQAFYEDTRKCGRIIWDDADMVAKIWARCEPLVPEIKSLANMADVTGYGPVKRREVWKVSRCNERMRILKYTKGEYFKAHADGMYETPDGKERSYYTLHLYLNDTDHQPPGEEALEGGATTFWGFDMKRRLDVAPKMGSVLIFQQRYLLHSGDDVVRGTKITLRTDLMYMKSDEEAPLREEKKTDSEPFGPPKKKAPGWVAKRLGKKEA